MKDKRVAVIGAGLSGCTLALGLQSRGHCVEVFEKSRGPGGRFATRRAQGFCFDHGAQFFTARSADFKKFLRPYIDSGVLANWSPRLVQLGGKRRFKRSWFEPHYVAVPGMNQWLKCKRSA